MGLATLVGMAGMGTEARGDQTGFAAGSLIIPMDACFQAAPDMPKPAGCVDGKDPPDDGAVAAYGVVTVLLQRGVRVSVAIDDNKKKLDDPDFSITDASGSAPVRRLNRATDGVVSFTSQTTVTYRGAPFIIDAVDAPTARQVLRGELGSASTAVHVAQVPFTAKVALQLAVPPARLAIVDVCNGAGSCTKGGAPSGEGIPLLQAYLRRAGLDRPGDVGTMTTPGVFADVITLTDINTRGPLATGRYGLVWLPHYAAPVLGASSYALQTADLNALRRLTRFAQDGGALVGTCASVWTLEGGQDPSWISWLPPSDVGTTLYDLGNGGGGVMNQVNGCYPGNSAGFQTAPLCSTPIAPVQAPSGRAITSDAPANPLVQIGDFAYHNAFDLAPQNNLANDVGNWDIKPSGAWSSGVIHLIRSSDQSLADDRVDMFTLAPALKGSVIYLGGHSHAELGALSTAGMRLLLNTLLFARPGVDPQELSRSGAILSADGKRLYVGSFKDAPPGLASFSTAADAAAWVFPKTEGHLREYDLSKVSDRVSLRPGLETWDAALVLPAGPSRRVLTQQGSGADARFVDFTSAGAAALLPSFGLPANATEADAAALIDAVRGGRLGGIDHSTLALVDGSRLVSGALLRPTVAFVGALDGQLHAIGVAGSGVTPGVELWSFLPAEQLPRLRDGSAGVDGNPNVRDLFDDFGGTGIRTWRTYLAATQGARGRSVFAIDVSDPLQPQLRWQRGDTAADGGVVLGNARGATFGLVAAAGVPGPSAALFVATSLPAGAGVQVTALSGRDGHLLWSRTQGYAKTAPGGGALPNDMPPPPSLADRARGGVEDTVYVGDSEGKIWELGAGLGQGGVLYDVGPTPEGHTQPIGAPLALYRDRDNGHLMVAAVTGGTDWAAPSDTYSVYVIDVDAIDSQRGQRGVLRFQTPIKGRGYAAPVVSGYDLYVTGSEGLMGQSSGALRGSIGDAGTMQRINLQSGQVTQSVATQKTAGSVQIAADGRLVIPTVGQVQLSTVDGGDTRGGGLWERQRLASRLWLQSY